MMERWALKSQKLCEATMFMIIKQVNDEYNKLAKNQVTDNKQVNRTKE